MIGQILGHYRILEKLGAGGMGEVYRAEDLTLKRQVALKILPLQIAESPEKIERFQREAETLAALDHPNIVTLYSVEQAQTATGGNTSATSTELHFLTMQLVDGKPLSDLIPEHGLSAEQVVELGISLIEAIRAAHEKGVIHRDLKPANVMIDHEGRAKVLDFGLAKLTWTEPDDTASALATEAMTQEGVILGTIPYMSPEQIQGNPVDRRTDFYSLGILLYEMLCGQRPFTAPNTAALLSSILRDAPSPVTGHKPEVPESLQRFLQKCLEKDPLLRYQTAEEIWLDLREIQRTTSSSVSSEIEAAVERALAKGASGSAVPPTASSGSSSSTASVASASHPPATRSAKALRWFAALGVCGGLLATGYIIFLANRGEVPPRQAIPAQLVHKQLTSLPGTEQYPSLSPDGDWVIFSAEGTEYQDIHLQSVGGQKSFNLTAGSESDNSQPCFSPDGTRIAFRSSRDGGGIFVMGRTGEAVRRVAADGFNPTWSPDGTAIAFATESVDLNPLNWEGETQLRRVDVETGEQVELTATNAVQPAWSPDGQRIAYVARLGDPTRMDLASISVHGGEPTTITEDEFTEWSPEWSPDGRYLYFASDRSGSMNLWRIAVDTDTGQPTGPPEPFTTPATFLAHPRVATDGSGIAYSSVFMTQNVQQIGFDVADPTSRAQADWVTSGSSLWSSVDPSPDGQQLAFYSRARPEGNLYIIRTDGTGLRQLTGDTAIDRVPRWSPDGEWIAFFSDRSGSLQVWRIRPDGSDLQQLSEHDGHASLVAWSPDGSKIAVLAGLGPDSETVVFDPDKSWSDQELQILPTPEEEGLRYVVTSWSPDGSMLAGQAGFNNSGIVLYSFVSDSYRRLTEFGEWPVWLPDSRRLLFVSDGRTFLVTSIDGSEPEEIFSVSRDVIGPPRVAEDGRRIFFTRRVTEADIWLLAFGGEDPELPR